jgi:hypothetical protein
MGLRLEDCKLGASAHWFLLTSNIKGTVQKEFYDSSTQRPVTPALIFKVRNAERNTPAGPRTGEHLFCPE